ncbi:MAG: hypothetical protein KTR35_18175 [Gammaproteobacteria bacterium]|nr:hypothetical protein [Gammaproteobacteria bacterium]
MRLIQRIGLSSFLSMCVLFSAMAQDVDVDEAAAACIEAARLMQEDQDYDGALEEASWCVEGLKQIKQAQTLAVFPDEVEGFVGGEVSNESMLGMNMIERTYQKENNSIKISLMAGGSGAGASGLAALAQLGMGLGGAGGGKKIRVQKRTVIDSSEGSNSAFMVQLKSGGMMNVESSTVSRDETLEFLRIFPIAEIDDALKQ